VAPFGQRLVGCQAQRCWEEIMTSSDFATRKQAVQQYNAGTREGSRRGGQHSCSVFLHCLLLPILPPRVSLVARSYGHHAPLLPLRPVCLPAHQAPSGGLLCPSAHICPPTYPAPLPSAPSACPCSPPLPQAGPGGGAHKVRHLLHNKVPQPGGGAGAHLHRWVGWSERG
jgi:hypothetical protein